MAQKVHCAAASPCAAQLPPKACHFAAAFFEAGRFGMASAASGLRHPASASCLGRHSRLAGRCPNNSSLFPPLAAVVVVASHIQRKKFRVCRTLRSAPNAFSQEGVTAVSRIFIPTTPKQPDRPGGAVWLRGLILPASCWRGPLLRRAARRRPAGASCRRDWGNRWAG